MPGLINNTTILTADNQLIKSQNDIETAITAISATHASLLAAITTMNTRLEYLENLTYQSSLVYLKYLEQIANKSAVSIGGSYSFADETEELSFRCKASNLIWQGLREMFNNLSVVGVIEIARDNGVLDAAELMLGAITGVAGLVALASASSVVGIPIAFPALVIGAETGLMGLAVHFFNTSLADIDFNAFGGLVSKLDSKKSDFIFAIYNSKDNESGYNAAIASLGILNQTESYIIHYLFKPSDLLVLKSNSELPDPTNPVICTGQTYTDEWIYGTPNMLLPIPSHGDVTSQNIGGVELIKFTTIGRYVSFNWDWTGTLPESTITATYRREGDTTDRLLVLTRESGLTVFHSDGDYDCVALQLAANFQFVGDIWVREPL